jgi:hypothetical protein
MHALIIIFSQTDIIAQARVRLFFRSSKFFSPKCGQTIFINKINQPTIIFYKELRSFDFSIALGDT